MNIQIQEVASKIDEKILQGHSCAEALILMALDLKGQENELMVQSAAGLSRGMHTQSVCGALTAGAMMLSMFHKSLAASQMIPDLLEWFDEEYGMEYGSMNCEDISGPRYRYKAERCKQLTIAVGVQCVELLKQQELL